MNKLILPLKAEYFLAIKSGVKREEYRLRNDYWSKRLEGKSFDIIELTLGYPAAEDSQRRMIRLWKGYIVRNITHPLFGPDPVEVYAIKVNREDLS